MPLTNFPTPGADLFNAGVTLKDRGTWLQAGTFTWLPSGSHAFTGYLIGYASSTSTAANMGWVTGGGVSIDGGPFFPIYGWSAVTIGRWVTSSVAVSGGIAWGVAMPVASTIISNYEVTRAVDRLHKQGSYLQFFYNYNPPNSNTGANMIDNGDLCNFSNDGFVTAASVQLAYIPPGIVTDPQYALDFYIDGVFRFNVGVSRLQNIPSDQLRPGMGASFGYIPFASNLRVAMRQSSGGATMHVDAVVQFVLYE